MTVCTSLLSGLKYEAARADELREMQESSGR